MLLITMVIQPAAISYAMTAMEHSHQGGSAISDDSRMMAHHDMAMSGEHDHHPGDTGTGPDDATGVSSDDCCHTAACCPAAVSVSEFVADLPQPMRRLSIHVFGEDVDLPTDTKPPRILLS